MSEKVFVENLNRSDPYSFGILSYKVIADHVFQDLALAGAFQSVRILIDIEKPLFYITGEINLVESPIRISDIATMKLDEADIHLTIEDETYAPDLLKLLWTRFGREQITQLDRWNLLIPSPLISIEELSQLVAVNPSDRILNKILDALNRIIPEGFRVRQTSFRKERITIIASENPLEPKWIQQAEVALQDPPVPIPATYMEKLKREPKKTDQRVVPWKSHEFQESIK